MVGIVLFGPRRGCLKPWNPHYFTASNRRLPGWRKDVPRITVFKRITRLGHRDFIEHFIEQHGDLIINELRKK